jgi:hypothetical protein
MADEGIKKDPSNCSAVANEPLPDTLYMYSRFEPTGIATRDLELLQHLDMFISALVLGTSSKYNMWMKKIPM